MFRSLPGLVCSVLACFVCAGSVRAQETDGMFITVGNPITENVLKSVRNRVTYAVERQNRSIRTIVFDFNPGNNPAGTSDSGQCINLANYIRDLSSGRNPAYPAIKTIAFVHNEVSRHTVLPVLACNDIIMSDEIDKKTGQPKARIGDILRDREGDLTGTVEEKAYEIMVRGFPAREVFLKMVRGERRGSWIYADEAQKTGLTQTTFNSRARLAEFLKLPPQSLKEDWLVGGPVIAWRVDLQGPLTAAKTSSMRRRIGEALGKDANLIIFSLESPEGDTRDAGDLAAYISNLPEEARRPVKTIAFIPSGTSLGAASLIALACNEIYMARGSTLGDFAYLPEDPAILRPQQEMMVKLARDQGFSELPFQAMFDSKLVLFKARSMANPGEFRVMTEQQLEKEKGLKNPRWQEERRLNPETGKRFRLDADLARELRIIGDNKIDSLEALYAQIPDLNPHNIRVARVDWLDRVAEFFREPIVNVLLLMLGIIGLTLELKMPGTTLPGVLGAICFVLFFWSYSFVNGGFTMLAVLLFVLGLVLLGLEIFVVPGFGVPGVAGVLLVVGSLVLVTLEQMPQSAGDWERVLWTLMRFGGSVIGAITAAVVLAWYLPNVPYVNRLILKPPAETGEDESTPAPLSETRGDLLGAIGIAATVLRPAGKARFGDEFLDVFSQGEYVNTGSRVQIVEIEGNRIVVKEV